MAAPRLRPTLLALVAMAALLALPQGARAAKGGLAGDDCSDDSECMSRTCGSDGACVATTCGMDPAKGGIGPSPPAGYCSSSQFYNPNRVCTFGFGKCAKAECCDTLSCGAGVADLQKASYCPPTKAFAATRLCPGGKCTPADCCAQTRCDSAGGVPVTRRPTFCPSGFAFNNAGICAAGQGRCASDDCCALDTRTCAVAFADPAFKLSCPAPTVLVGSRIYDATKANGGCCETTTCATGVTDAAKVNFCASYANTVFLGTPTCPSGTCTPSDCCQSSKGFCDGDGIKQADGSCKCADATKTYVIGFGCACSAGTQLEGGVCKPCPYGYYSGMATAAQTCTRCPTNQPYTASTGSNSADKCINYCDQALMSGMGACSNGGTCASLNGDPAVGSFTCTCPATWMGYGATPNNNCDAPTTLLRLRVLAASGVALPTDLKLLVTDTPNDNIPAYALQAPSLACALSGNPTTPTVPTCTTGGAGALSAAATGGSAAETRNFVGTKVKLSTNYKELVAAGKVPDADFVIEWACSDGVEGDTAEMAIVLPGPANTNGAMTLVCTAIVSHAAMTTPVKLQLSDKSVVPEAFNAGSGPALLTFAQSGPICSLPMPAKAGDTAAAPECAYNEQPFEGGKPGSLGVSNVDMEKYTVAWTCASKDVATDADGNAATPDLPSPGQAVLVCSANFQVKTTQVALSVSSVADVDIQLTAMQKGMNEACVVTIPAGTKTAKDVALSCPVSNLNSGVDTTLATNADLTKYLVTFDCTPAVGKAFTARRSTVVQSTPNGQATPTSCVVTVTALPALLSLRINNVAGARAFKAFASQDASDTCVVASDNQDVLCYLKDGMMPGVTTTLSPRALDANKYALLWACSGATATNAFSQAQFSNSATVVLNANPNADGGLVTCIGTVASRSTPVTVFFEASSAVQSALPSGAEARVRQSHQSKACAATKPVGAPVPPVCDSEGLDATKGTRTTFSTGNVDLSQYKVSWSCQSNAVVGGTVPTTLVAAGIATAETQGPGTTIVCKAAISTKPPVLTLASTGAGPSTAWSLSARQSTQGRACTVLVAASSLSTPATAPSCEIQQLMPARTTVLAASGLDSSRWNVVWSCTRFDGSAVILSDTLSSTGALVANSKTVSLDKDANAGGGPIACTAAVSARGEVLLLAATGDLPEDDKWTLTAKQSTQSMACSVAAKAAKADKGAAPSCDAGVLGFTAGAPVQLGASGLPPSSIVTWSCTSPDMVSGVNVENGNSGVASLTPPAGTVTTCTAKVVGQTTPFFQIVADKGVTFSAFQGVGEAGAKPMCTVTSDGAGKPQVCDGAAPTAATTLVATLDEGMAADTIVRFSCKLGSNGVPMPVSKTSGLSATVMSPPAVETIVCTASVVGKPPILVVTSNVATVLTALAETKAVCTSSTATNKLVCDAGTGDGQLPGKVRVNLSQAGFTQKGYYRWSCSSSAANIVRAGDQTIPEGKDASTATITLPEDGKSLTCSLTYTVDEPKLGRRRLARLLLL